jgi:hypothetical protein
MPSKKKKRRRPTGRQMDSFEKNQLGIDLLPNGETRGKDPRKMSRNLLGETGHEARPLLFSYPGQVPRLFPHGF